MTSSTEEAEQEYMDFAYVIDTTASMDQYFEAARNTIQNVVLDVTAKNPKYRFRFACVSYKDWGDYPYRIQSRDFTEDIDEFMAWLFNISCFGGDDQCEDVLGGLREVIELNWQSKVKVVYHICDAPPHNKLYHDNALDYYPDGYQGADFGGKADPPNYHQIVLNGFKAHNIDLYAIAKMNFSCETMIKVFKDYADTLPLTIKEVELANADDLVDQELVNQDLISSVVKVIHLAIDSIEIVAGPAESAADFSEIKDSDASHWNPYRRGNTYQCHVGIDFGTSGTGFAYALTDGEIYWQQQWTGDASSKERTNILLEKKTKRRGKLAGSVYYKCVGFGSDATHKYQSQPRYKNCLYFEKFKMALYDEELSVKQMRTERVINVDEAEMDADAESDAEADAKEEECAAGAGVVSASAEEVKADEEEAKVDASAGFIRKESYLRAANGELVPTQVVFTQALRFMKKVIMKTLKSLEILNETDIQWILTVPAIWSNYAKTLMRNAVKEAEMINENFHDHLKIATEPECASVIARKQLAEQLNHGDKYILLDLGGGTADIACHKILDDERIEQVFPAQGGNWGSTYIDKAFVRFLYKLFGEQKMKDYKVHLSTSNKRKDWIKISENFRDAKHSYDGKSNTIVILPISLVNFMTTAFAEEADDDNDDILEEHIEEYVHNTVSGLLELDDSNLEMNAHIWNEFFGVVLDPIVHRTREILQTTEMQGTQHILLAGGLTTSVYVRDTIVSAFSEYNVHSLPRPILAVVSGACAYGLNPTKLTDKYVVQNTIGIQVRRQWKDGIDSEDPSIKLYDESKKQFMIHDAFHVLFSKGDTIDASELRAPIFFKASHGLRQKQVRIQLFHSVLNATPLYIHEDGCSPLCEPTVVNLPNDWITETDLIPIQFWYSGSEFRAFIAAAKWDDTLRNIHVQWIEELH